MSKKDTTEEPSEEVEAVEVKEKPKCFVIMPISDHDGYEPGHFDRVYEQMIKPAVIEAGFLPIRADDTKRTHIIILEILKAIVEYDMAICDMSSLNPNVMYELGIRQMNRKPVVLIKDEKTRRIFDTGLMSDIEYSSSLRIDKVKVAIQSIALSIKNTYENFDEKANSLIDLLGVDVQIQKKTIEVTEGEKMILNILSKSERYNAAEEFQNVFIPNEISSRERTYNLIRQMALVKDTWGEPVERGDIVAKNFVHKTPVRSKEISLYMVFEIFNSQSLSVTGCKLSNKEIENIPIISENTIGYKKLDYKYALEIMTPDEHRVLNALKDIVTIPPQKAPF